MNTEKECRNPWLCFFLGFFLPVVGLVVSAIIGKGMGVIRALVGIAIRYVFVFLLVFLRVAQERSEGATEKAEREDRPVAYVPRVSANATWTMEKKRLPAGGKAVTVSRRADYPVGGGVPLLIARSEGDRREAYVAWPSPMGNGAEAFVTVRFDDYEALAQRWKLSKDRRVAFSPFAFVDFFGLMRSARRLEIRSGGASAVFTLSGLDGVLDDEARDAFR